MSVWDRAQLSERRRVTVHEASHACAAHLVGGRAKVRLTIARDASGLCRFYGLTTVTCHTPDHGFVAAAGVAGELKFCEATCLAAPPVGAIAADMQCIDDATRIEGDGLYSPREIEIERARRMFDDDTAVWGCVLLLAEELKAVWPASPGVGEMNAERVAAICRSAGLRGTNP